MPTFNFTTGPTTLPDLGKLSYNGCLFSPLFFTTLSGTMVKDAANRTVKYVEYVLMVDGYVTLQDGDDDIAPTMRALRDALEAQGGQLVYDGRGFDLIVNAGPGSLSDVAWGPAPEIIEFQPLGGGRSAKVQWKCVVRVPEVKAGGHVSAGLLLQFNYETSVSYGEDGYSTISVRGTLEIPLTRATQSTRTVVETADRARVAVDSRIMAGIDLDRFTPSKRNISVSRDKRTLEWDFEFVEKPYMDLPPACTVAHGTYSVRPAKQGMGLCTWLCSLRVTYTVRRDRPRRLAWLSFLALLRLRMGASRLSVLPPAGGLPGGAPPDVHSAADLLRILAAASPLGAADRDRILRQIREQNEIIAGGRRAWLIDFSFDEGMHQDSKTTSFSATWRLVATFSSILLASGLWTKVVETDATGKNLWAISTRSGLPGWDVAGARSWLPNEVDPTLDAIIDFGGP